MEEEDVEREIRDDNCNECRSEIMVKKNKREGGDKCGRITRMKQSRYNWQGGTSELQQSHDGGYCPTEVLVVTTGSQR